MVASVQNVLDVSNYSNKPVWNKKNQKKKNISFHQAIKTLPNNTQLIKLILMSNKLGDDAYYSILQELGTDTGWPELLETLGKKLLENQKNGKTPGHFFSTQF